MNRPLSTPAACRPREHLAAIARRYPDCWARLDDMRRMRGAAGVGEWPDWCFLPMAASYAVVARDGRVASDRIADVGRLAALAAWRLTQGVYRFDPVVREALCATPVPSDIGHDLLLRLPEWCVYLETPGMTWMKQPLQGVFVHLEFDANDHTPELRLVADTEAGLLPLPLHLGPWPLLESIRRVSTAPAKRAMLSPGAVQAGAPLEILQSEVEPVISLVLHLCAHADRIRDGARRPGRPQPKPTKKGPRLFAAEKATTWTIGPFTD